MSRTIRVFWQNQATGWKNFNWGGVIDARSVIHIAASEGAASFGGFGDPLNNISRTRGLAVIGVRNVTPHEGGVEFFLEVGWETPLNVVTDISVLDPAEQGHLA